MTQKEQQELKNTIKEFLTAIKGWNESLADMLQKIKDTKTK